MKKILIYLSIVFMISLFIGCGCNKNKNKKVITQDIISNNNEEIYLKEEKDNINYRISSLTIAEKKYSTIIIEITNNTDDVVELKPFKLDFIDKDDNNIYSAIIDDTSKIKPNETILVDHLIDINLKDATKVKYSFIN